MTFVAGTGATAVLRTVIIVVTAILAGFLRWLIGSLWCLVPIAFAFPFLIWYVPRLTDSLYGEMNRERLYVRYGLVWRRETVVPLHALRTFEAWTPPIHALFGCRTVVLRFAGGSVYLPLLDEKTARKVAERLEES